MTRRFQQGNIIVYQGEVPRTMYIVKSGIVKLYNITQQGDERIVDFKLAGDIFPTSWTFDQMAAAFYYYEAQTDCEVYSASFDEFQTYISKNVDALKALSEGYLGKYAGSLMRITALEQPKATDKVLFTLYYLVQGYGRQISPGVYRIAMQLTQQMIADLIGLTRETTAAELVKLKKREILTYRGREYTIDRQKLVSAIGEDNFKHLQIWFVILFFE